MSGHAVETQRGLLAVTDEDCILAAHAIEFDVNFIAIVVFGIKGNCLKGDGQV